MKLAVHKEVSLLLLPEEVPIVRHEVSHVAAEAFNISIPALKLREQWLLPCHGDNPQEHCAAERSEQRFAEGA